MRGGELWFTKDPSLLVQFTDSLEQTNRGNGVDRQLMAYNKYWEVKLKAECLEPLGMIMKQDHIPNGAAQRAGRAALGVEQLYPNRSSIRGFWHSAS